LLRNKPLEEFSSDRDNILRVIQEGKDMGGLAIRYLMTRDPIVLKGDKELFEAMRKFEEY
jgi:hypothetical protein